MSRLDFETKPLDPTSIVKSLGRYKEKELRSEIREAYLSDLRSRMSSFKISFKSNGQLKQFFLLGKIKTRSGHWEVQSMSEG